MTEKIQNKPSRKQIFNENPLDIETVFESLSVASDNDLELIYMDSLIYNIRNNPEGDLTDISYQILKEMKAI